MIQHTSSRPPAAHRTLSRRSMLQSSAATAALALVASGTGFATDSVPAATPRDTAAGGEALRPLAAIPAILAAIERYPLVAITERHTLQEWHDVISALLFHPDLPGKIDDVVVEFGNAAYQDLADRFILSDRPVANADLEQIWRQIGDPTWNAPVYARFFRNVRAINWALPPSRRIRVLLGQPPITMSQVLAHPTDRALATSFVVSTPMNAHYAAVVEREVLRKGRKALLIAGGGHTLRGLRDDSNPHQLNAATRLARRHPGKLFVIDLLILPPGQQQDALARRVQAAVTRWPRPAVASLAGTWLGAISASAPPWINAMAYRAVNTADTRYETQADAVLYLGPGETLTASRSDPAIYHWGAYARQLRRLGPIVSLAAGERVDLIAMGLHGAQAGPSWFAGLGS